MRGVLGVLLIAAGGFLAFIVISGRAGVLPGAGQATAPTQPTAPAPGNGAPGKNGVLIAPFGAPPPKTQLL